MDCPLCSTPMPGWHQLHRHLADAHSDAVLRSERGDGSVGFVVTCPVCDWSFEKLLTGKRGDADFVAEFGREMVLVAFDQFMVHWVEDHIVEPDDNTTGENGGDS